MTKEPHVRRRPDGSIDTDHYLRIARGERAHATQWAKASVTRRTKQLASAMCALIVVSFPRARHG